MGAWHCVKQKEEEARREEACTKSVWFCLISITGIRREGEREREIHADRVRESEKGKLTQIYAHSISVWHTHTHTKGNRLPLRQNDAIIHT